MLTIAALGIVIGVTPQGPDFKAGGMAVGRSPQAQQGAALLWPGLRVEPVEGGGLVSIVVPPADRAGLRVGDLLIAVDGNPVRDMGDVGMYLADTKGHTVTVRRNGRMLQLVVEAEPDP